MAPKKPSGAEFRKLRKAREEENRKLSQHWQHWLTKSKEQEGSSATPSVATPIDINEPTPTKTDVEGNITEEEVVEEKEDDDDDCQPTPSACSFENYTEDPALGSNVDAVASSVLQLNFNDPTSWPDMTDKVRCCLVEHGPEQKKNADFSFSASDDGRRFYRDWFTKILPNGETVERTWLMYGETKKAIYCFPCMLFAKKSSTTSSLANPKKGFCDWKHLNPRIPDHENSPEHRDSYLRWKNFEMCLKTGATIDDQLQRSIASEKEKWRTILKIILDAILFCAKNNLALRGSTEIIGHTHSGIFLNLLELISHYNPELAGHIANHKKGSATYFSPTIQNEFINLLGSTVRREIIAKIKEAKYFSIMFDCTPDVAHKEQMSQIIRYVRIQDNDCTVEESFIDFIISHEKTGSGLAAEIEKKLSDDGLDIANCRGQGYDNGANMAGKYRGVQARIAQVNEHARFVPCAAHSLNLVGVHAASVSVDMVSFFGTVQRLFTFFVASTSRWEVLSQAVKVTLKGHTETRWSSKFRAVHSLHLQIPEVLKALYQISEDATNADAVSTAQSLIKQIDFKFLCTLAMWDKILNLIERVNQLLQCKGLPVDSASKHISGLRDALQHIRDDGIHDVVQHAAELAEQMSLNAEFTEKRKRKVKRMADENVEDEGHLISAEQDFKMQFNNVLDTLTSQIQWRYEALSEVAADFNFLTGLSFSTMEVSELKKCAADLAMKYSNDLDACEIVYEVESFKFQAASVLPNFSNATPLSLLKLIHKWSLSTSYPNIEIALRLFLTLPVTVASCERSFSKLKLIKTYLRSSMGQERLSNLAILSIENAVASAINFDKVIDEFASLKARKVHT